uniref:Ig-like domain-containing protein n=1 Tax=Salvator merianae TaxID=96440 RepID=A0A8D0DQZ9_SALMN
MDHCYFLPPPPAKCLEFFYLTNRKMVVILPHTFVRVENLTCFYLVSYCLISCSLVLPPCIRDGRLGPRTFFPHINQPQSAITLLRGKLQMDKARQLSFPSFSVDTTAKVSLMYPMEMGHHNVLVCFVDTFLPPVVNITWLKNGQLVSQGVDEVTFYPSVDGTFRKFSHLLLVPEDGDVYVCQVEHRDLDRPLQETWSKCTEISDLGLGFPIIPQSWAHQNGPVSKGSHFSWSGWKKPGGFGPSGGVKRCSVCCQCCNQYKMHHLVWHVSHLCLSDCRCCQSATEPDSRF